MNNPFRLSTSVMSKEGTLQTGTGVRRGPRGPSSGSCWLEVVVVPSPRPSCLADVRSPGHVCKQKEHTHSPFTRAISPSKLTRRTVEERKEKKTQQNHPSLDLLHRCLEVLPVQVFLPGLSGVLQLKQNTMIPVFDFLAFLFTRILSLTHSTHTWRDRQERTKQNVHSTVRIAHTWFHSEGIVRQCTNYCHAVKNGEGRQS